MKLTDMIDLFNKDINKSSGLMVDLSEARYLKKKYQGISYEIYMATTWVPMEEVVTYADPWYTIVNVDNPAEAVTVPTMDREWVKMQLEDWYNDGKHIIMGTHDWDLVD